MELKRILAALALCAGLPACEIPGVSVMPATSGGPTFIYSPVDAGIKKQMDAAVNETYDVPPGFTVAQCPKSYYADLRSKQTPYDLYWERNRYASLNCSDYNMYNSGY